MPPKTSLFICGDFNFNLTRPGFMETLSSREFEIFPKQQDRKRPIDFVLVRGRHVNIQSCEQSHPSKPFRKRVNDLKADELGVAKVEEDQEEVAKQESSNQEEELRLLIASFPETIRLVKIKSEPKQNSDFLSPSVKAEENDPINVSVKEITTTDGEGLPPPNDTKIRWRS